MLSYITFSVILFIFLLVCFLFSAHHPPHTGMGAPQGKRPYLRYSLLDSAVPGTDLTLNK